jgi:DNA-binding IclR family transcriptional regulator
MQVTEPEYALTLTERYQAVHETYKSHYISVDKQQREYMRENIAPVLDKARAVLIAYNKSVIAGESSPESKQEFIRLLRQVSTKLLEVQND